MRFFGAADQHSLYFLANWRKGGVQRSGVFGELIGDACHGRGRGIQFELKNGRLTGNRNLPGARCRSTWSKIRSPAGFDRCSAASRGRAARIIPSRCLISGFGGLLVEFCRCGSRADNEDCCVFRFMISSSLEVTSSFRRAHFVAVGWSMIRKSGYRFSEKIMLKQKDRVG
jgi:hypothetical protein